MQTLSVSSGSGGECDGISLISAASVLVEWTALNFDADLHQYKVYENNVLKSTQTTTSYSRDVVGRIAGGSFPIDSDWTFRVDLCDLEGDAISSMVAAEWSVGYGRCFGLPGDPEA